LWVHMCRTEQANAVRVMASLLGSCIFVKAAAIPTRHGYPDVMHSVLLTGVFHSSIEQLENWRLAILVSQTPSPMTAVGQASKDHIASAADLAAITNMDVVLH
jgi:hypothetical protein